MASYPIWNKVQACIYKSNKSYGVRENGVVSIKVGTSATNSYDFLTHTTTHKKLECGGREFRFYIDDILAKKAFLPKGGNELEMYWATIVDDIESEVDFWK